VKTNIHYLVVLDGICTFSSLSAYIQSEEFPKIHAIVEYIKEYKDVSAFMCMFLKLESDREYICSVSTGV
jgi:hypothetical protein